MFLNRGCWVTICPRCALASCGGVVLIAAASAAVLTLSPTAFAQQGGTAAEAKAMLMKAVAAVKADNAKALDMFNKGEGGFLDRDLYVFCVNLADAKIVAIGNPNAKDRLGTDMRAGKDKSAQATQNVGLCESYSGLCGLTEWVEILPQVLQT